MSRLLHILLFIILPLTAVAQNNQSEFEEFLKEAQGEFDSYEKQINHEFVETLRQQWEEFEVFSGERRPEMPKPKEAPVAQVGAPVISEVIQGTPAPVENSLGRVALRLFDRWLTWKLNAKKQDKSAMVARTIVDKSEKSTMAQGPQPIKKMVSFYNVPVSVDVPSSYTDYKMSDIKEGDVADFWSFLTKSDYEYVVKQIAVYANRMGLDGWSLFKLVEIVSDGVFSRMNRADEGEVFKVFLANQLGLDVKIGRADNNLISMISIGQKVYEWLYIKNGEKRYYIRKKNGDQIKSLYTYNQVIKHPLTQVNLLTSVPNPLSPPAALDTTIFKSKVLGCDIAIPMDTNLCHFYAEFPQVRSDIPAMLNISEHISKPLYDAIHPKVQGMSQYDAVDFIMKFMHHDFEYATDDEQFGHEKPFFYEEDFLYPYNDCEDRSILFSRIVRDVLGMDVVLLHYPGHIATAVAFDEDITGCYVVVDNKRYFVCDPTYINAPPGLPQPAYKKVKCQIYRI